MQWRWMVAAILSGVLAGSAEARSPVRPFETGADLAPNGRIDQLVFGQLAQLGIEPALLCSDAVFLRRVYLDVLGTLPTADETKAFLADKDARKRSVLVDRVLERKEFVDYWAMKWSDLLRVKSEFPINLWPNAVQGYHRWIRKSIRENKPYDRFVRELLVSNGSNFRAPEVNFYRAVQSREPQALAQVVALTFMGVRPEGFSKDRWAGMAAFFAQVDYKATGEWKEEIVLFNPNKAVTSSGELATTPVFPDGTPARVQPGQDPREVFAAWLVTAQNPWFGKNIVNRIWSWLLGRGIIHEPDNIRADNPPSNPQLLAYLEGELESGGYDLKHIFRLILNSKTYQLSSIAANPDARGDAHFSHYGLRRLEAEVLIDALCQITGTTEEYSSPIPEPFTYIPENQRSTALADGSITSSFLEMFGRSPRDTGLESERNNRTTADQRLHMLNSSHIQRKIEEGPKLRAILQSKRRPREVMDEIYLTILSRFPTDEEARIMANYVREGKDRRPAIDLVWALVNSTEFLYRH